MAGRWTAEVVDAAMVGHPLLRAGDALFRLRAPKLFLPVGARVRLEDIATGRPQRHSPDPVTLDTLPDTGDEGLDADLLATLLRLARPRSATSPEPGASASPGPAASTAPAVVLPERALGAPPAGPAPPVPEVAEPGPEAIVDEHPDHARDPEQDARRFVLRLDFRALGPLEVEIRGRGPGFAAILRTAAPIPPALRRDLADLFGAACEITGTAGQLLFVSQGPTGERTRPGRGVSA